MKRNFLVFFLARIDPKHFTKEEVGKFDEAKAAEIKSILDCRAIRVLDLKERAHVYKHEADRIVPSRFVLTWKTSRDGPARQGESQVGLPSSPWLWKMAGLSIISTTLIFTKCCFSYRIYSGHVIYFRTFS